MWPMCTSIAAAALSVLGSEISSTCRISHESISMRLSPPSAHFEAQVPDSPCCPLPTWWCLGSFAWPPPPSQTVGMSESAMRMYELIWGVVIMLRIHNNSWWSMITNREMSYSKGLQQKAGCNFAGILCCLFKNKGSHVFDMNCMRKCEKTPWRTTA